MLGCHDVFLGVVVSGCVVCVISLFFCVLFVHASMVTSAAFVVVVALLVVCSLFRAHGGCLGMLSR